MPVISKSALVNHSADRMFMLVDDIEAYPQFLPWCGGARVLARDADSVHASIDIAHGAVRKTFATRNQRHPSKMIEMRLIEGPFRHLHGFWRFDALGEGACKVSLNLEYEFSSSLLGLMVGPVFAQIANTLVDAFVKRADSLQQEGG